MVADPFVRVAASGWHFSCVAVWMDAVSVDHVPPVAGVVPLVEVCVPGKFIVE